MLEKCPIKPNYLDFDNLETINKNAEKFYGYHRIFFDLPIIKKASNGNISENFKIFLDRLTNSANQYIHDSEAKRLKQLEAPRAPKCGLRLISALNIRQ